MFLPIVEFFYNNPKNVNTSPIPFKLNCGYSFWISYKGNVDLQFKSKSVDKLSAKVRELMILCRENLYHTQKFQKQAYSNSFNLKSYAFDNKIWLNSNYIKTKQNHK